MSRLKVVYVGHVAQLSGAEIALSRLLPALSDRVDTHVILAEDGPLATTLREGGAVVEILTMAETARDVRKDAVGIRHGRALGAASAYTWRLTQRLRDLQPDLVHTNSLKAALYGGAAGCAARIPVVWHIRDRIAPDYLPQNAVRLVRAAARVMPAAVITNSAATKRTLPALGNAVHVVADSVDVSAFAAMAAPRHSALRIGMLGRLAPWKGQHVFLQAFAAAFADDKVAGTRVQARVIGSAMFGEDDYASELDRLADRLGVAGRVDFRGYREDVAAELSELDVLVHSSTSPEPFGQVVIEGMAAGLPVIAANAGGPAEIITSGVDGVLVPPNDPQALASAMRRLAVTPELRRSIGAAAWKTASSYTPERTAAGVLAVYESVLRCRR